jgi:formylglycine-generating enzyme
MRTWPLGLMMLLLVVSCPRTAPARDPGRDDSRDVTNSIGMRFVPVPAGEFMMGSTESMDDMLKAFPAYKVQSKTDFLFQDEHPRHRVRITRPFYLGQYAVTVGQFKRFARDAGYKTEAERNGEGGWGYNPETGKCEGRDRKYNWRNPGFTQTDDHPVVDVTWNDAVAFCQWLSRKEGKTCRLPTEAEWEYACRAGTTARYSNGDDPNGLAPVANVQDAKSQSKFPHVQEIMMPNDGKFTIPVGSLAPNKLGLYDMHGNVWQWCGDWYGEDYYATSPVDDPAGPVSGNRRVRRGGAWNSFPLYVRAAFRNWNTPDSRCVNLGFRVLLTELPVVQLQHGAVGTVIQER